MMAQQAPGVRICALVKVSLLHTHIQAEPSPHEHTSCCRINPVDYHWQSYKTQQHYRRCCTKRLW